ncbi:hypothetical protein [Haemophilus paraphrohaemolyticus]|nr:hypothetical protein [Haemophilus paraphrohaemolyticus]
MIDCHSVEYCETVKRYACPPVSRRETDKWALRYFNVMNRTLASLAPTE